MKNAGLDETQAGIKIARRNVINLRYAGLPSMGSNIVRHDWSDLAAAAASAYLRLLIFLLTILIPVCASSNLAFLTIYSAYKLNKQGENMSMC